MTAEASHNSAPSPDGGPALIDVLANHRIDEARLEAWLRDHVPGFSGITALRQFQGGQSNPTYLIETPDTAYVLRKKPPGALLPSAHAVDREYRILRALAGSGVAVPPAFALCEDEAVIGTAFYVMAYVPGRVFVDPALPQCAADERAPLYLALAGTLAALHAVDWRGVGLQDFGRPENYLARQVRRWSQQFAASGLDSPPMRSLTDWVAAHIPPSDRTGEACAIAHGDYRIGNVIFDPAQPRIVAVLDWELATIGHPLADLAYSCLAWRVPAELRGLKGHPDENLPSERDYLAAYCAAMGRDAVPGFEFFVAFSLFRWAAIVAGVYRRALDGNAADASGILAGERFHTIARIGWDTARGA
jgi:aminoglycoside phosphotransferase (APT) family kinase protein